MKRSDKNVIQFLAKSPLQSFSGMLDALRYLDGQWIQEELEYELFKDALGDNRESKVTIRVPTLPGIAAKALFSFTRHAAVSHMLRRRPRKMRNAPLDADEVVVFYELTPAGRDMIEILEAIDRSRSH